MSCPGTVLDPVILEGNQSLPKDHPEHDGLIGDLLVRGGVYTPQTDAMIDVQVIYLNAPSRVMRMRGKKKKKGRPKLCQVDGEDFASCEEEEVTIPRPCEGCTVGEEGKGGTSTEGKKQTCQPPAEVQDRAESADFGLEVHGGEIKGKERKIDRATAALRAQES